MDSGITCHVCGKETDETAGCCSLSEYERALLGIKKYKAVSLITFLKMRIESDFRNSHLKLWFVARISTQRAANGERGKYVDLSGVYEWMGDAIFHTMGLKLNDQHRVHLMVKEPEDANYCYDNL
jgi:hypothetical protein